MSTIEQGHTGRVFYLRIHPNEDLVQNLEKTVIEFNVSRALVRSTVGSLAHCCLETAAGHKVDILGPAVEILDLNGEITVDNAARPLVQVNGMVMDINGLYHAGRFVAGRNPVCMTLEVVLEEWVVDQRLVLD